MFGTVAYSGKSVANEFLACAKEDGLELTNMKLQKLLYFAHGWHLAATGKPLLRDVIEAWKFGPVVADVYHEFKGFGINSIRTKATRFNGEKWVAPRISPDDEKTRNFIKKIWKNYKDFSGIQLSNLTHLDGTPWDKAWNEQGGKNRLNKDIDDKDIEAYFAEKLKVAG